MSLTHILGKDRLWVETAIEKVPEAGSVWREEETARWPVLSSKSEGGHDTRDEV